MNLTTDTALQHDGIKRQEVEFIVDNFPGQSIDFFGALRSRVYDDKVIIPPAKIASLCIHTACIQLAGIVGGSSLNLST